MWKTLRGRCSERFTLYFLVLRTPPIKRTKPRWACIIGPLWGMTHERKSVRFLGFDAICAQPMFMPKVRFACLTSPFTPSSHGSAWSPVTRSIAWPTTRFKRSSWPGAVLAEVVFRVSVGRRKRLGKGMLQFCFGFDGVEDCFCIIHWDFAGEGTSEGLG